MDMMQARQAYLAYVEQAANQGQQALPFPQWVQAMQRRAAASAPMSQQQFSRPGAVDPRMRNQNQLQQLLMKQRGLLD